MSASLVGSEMCIRDRAFSPICGRLTALRPFPPGFKPSLRAFSPASGPSAQSHPCDFGRGAVPVRPRSGYWSEPPPSLFSRWHADPVGA
eukprot:7856292-Alexandrium_andersonii.AAC.1